MLYTKDTRRRAIIVASGPSAKDFLGLVSKIDRSRVAVIAVNGAHDWLPYFDYWFSLDPSMLNRRRMANRKHNAKYFLAYKPDPTIPREVTILNRQEIKGPEYPLGKPRIVDDCYIDQLQCEPSSITSGNSAYGALNLAFHLGFDDVALLGIDANNDPRVEGGMSRDLSHLPSLFASAYLTNQIGITNCGRMRSVIPSLTLEDWLVKGPLNSRKPIDYSEYPSGPNREEDPVLVSFYTSNWEYKKRAQILRDQCDRLGIAHDIQERPNQGNWMANTRTKPYFIREMLNLYKSIIWLDADSQILKFPDLLLGPFEGDIQAVPHQTMPRAWHVAVLRLNSNERTKKLCDLWAEDSEQYGRTDEASLERVWRLSGVSTSKLPPEYHVYATKNADLSKAVIAMGISQDLTKKEVRALLDAEGKAGK